MNIDEMKFEALYSKEVNFLSNQGGGHHSNYPRKGRTKDGIEKKGGKTEIVNGGNEILIGTMGRRIDM